MLATVKAWDEEFSADHIYTWHIGLGVWKDGLLVRWQVARFQTENRQGTQLQKTVGAIPLPAWDSVQVRKVGAVLDTKNKVKDKANAVKENIKDMPTQTAYAVYSAKEKAKSSVSDFKRGMVQEQQSRQTGRLESRSNAGRILLTSVWSFKSTRSKAGTAKG